MENAVFEQSGATLDKFQEDVGGGLKNELLGLEGVLSLNPYVGPDEKYGRDSDEEATASE